MAAITENRVLSLRNKFGVTQRVMARMLGATERTLIDLEHGRQPSETISRRVTELSRLHKQLGRVVRPASIAAWMTNPNAAFDDDSPVDVIAKGKADLIWQMIFELRSGVAS